MIQVMRKKSHIILASFIADNLKANEVDDLNLQKMRGFFIMGSLLPDCKPSFLVGGKHSYSVKSKMIEAALRRLTDGYRAGHMPDAKYWENLGEVIHFIADFFTFPHNTNFNGTLAEHCTFEGELKRTLKKRIRSGEADAFCFTDIRFANTGEMIAFIRTTHDDYLSRKRNIDDDIRFIPTVTYLVTLGVIDQIRPKAGRTPAQQNEVSEAGAPDERHGGRMRLRDNIS